MIEEMWEKTVLGKHDGEALINVNFLNISQHFDHFGFRGRQEHHQLKFGDFKIVSTSVGEYTSSGQWNDYGKFQQMKGSSIVKCGPPTTKNTSLTDQVLCVSQIRRLINYNFMKAIVEKISDANGQKYSNQSNKKTLSTALLAVNNVERSDIGYLTGA